MAKKQGGENNERYQRTSKLQNSYTLLKGTVLTN